MTNTWSQCFAMVCLERGGLEDLHVYISTGSSAGNEAPATDTFHNKAENFTGTRET